MVNPDPEARITIDDIKEHAWFKSPQITEEDLLVSMKLRQKVIEQDLEFCDIKQSKKSLFHNFKIPNDNDVKSILRRSFKKGFQLRKYSDYFKYVTGEALFLAIKSFAENQGLRYIEDAKMSTVVIESEKDDVNVSFKANLIENPD